MQRFGLWRAWLLVFLLGGPVVAYVIFGALWLHEHGWLLIAGGIWVFTGVIFGILGARWTRAVNPVLPPINWDAPQTFAKIDRDAWTLVEAEADAGDNVSLDKLTVFDLYIDTGRRLAKRLAEHYHPFAADPLETVPIVDLLTALELAAEDLNQLCRHVPGGDMVTPAHQRVLRRLAIFAANDIYSFLLPIFSPVSGLVRLGTQQWMVKPAWRDMQQNLLRWFFRAYVNRLGMHLIELYSGRLAIGADRISPARCRRRGARPTPGLETEAPPLRIAVAGARGVGKTGLVEALNRLRSDDNALLKARLAASGLDAAAAQRLAKAELVEAPGYTSNPGAEWSRDRSTRAEALEQSVEADMLLLMVEYRRNTDQADAAFAKAWTSGSSGTQT